MPKLARSLTQPSNSAFKQQRLRACQPILTPVPVITTYFLVGLIFIPLGVVFYQTSANLREVEVRYDDNLNCEIGTVCSINITDLNLRAPVYMYYRLTNFYQNHRRYLRSRNDDQLRGVAVTSYSALVDCEPMRSLNGSQNPQDFYLPCGLIANSMFNDSFTLKNSSGGLVPLQKEGISWESDRKSKFANPPPDTPGIRVIPDFEDEDFIVWMRTAALPTFKKLYRIIHQDLQGNFEVQIFNNFPVKSFGGTKSIVLTELSWLGGKNPFLGIAYMATGSVCILLAIIFLIKHKFSGRRLGDTSYLEWNHPQ